MLKKFGRAFVDGGIKKFENVAFPKNKTNPVQGESAKTIPYYPIYDQNCQKPYALGLHVPI